MISHQGDAYQLSIGSSTATSAPPHMKGWMARVQIGKVTILFRVSRKVCTIILQNSGINRFQAGFNLHFDNRSLFGDGNQILQSNLFIRVC